MQGGGSFRSRVVSSPRFARQVGQHLTGKNVAEAHAGVACVDGRSREMEFPSRTSADVQLPARVAVAMPQVARAVLWVEPELEELVAGGMVTPGVNTPSPPASILTGNRAARLVVRRRALRVVAVVLTCWPCCGFGQRSKRRSRQRSTGHVLPSGAGHHQPPVWGPRESRSSANPAGTHISRCWRCFGGSCRFVDRSARSSMSNHPFPSSSRHHRDSCRASASPMRGQRRPRGPTAAHRVGHSVDPTVGNV